MTAVDINRGTSGVNLPMEVANEIWSRMQDESAIMRLATPMELPGAGTEVDMITGDPDAYWVAESEERTASKGTVSSKKIKAYNMSVLVPFSRQFARDKARLYDEMVIRMPGVLAKKFDGTVFGNVQTPGAYFDQLTSCTGVDVKTDPWAGLVSADSAISTAGGITNGFAISPQLKSILLNEKDGNDRPLYVNGIGEGGIPVILASPTYQSKSLYKAGTAPTTQGGTDGVPEVLGYAGDWTSARYGMVEGMRMSVSDQATIKIGDDQINLWQRGMFAIMLEIEIGFRVKYSNDFVKLTGDTPAYVPPASE